MTKNRKTVFIIILVAIFLLFSGWWLIGHWQGGSSSIRIVLIPKVVDDSDFWSSMIEGAEAGAKEYDAKLSVVGADSENDYEKQEELIREAILTKPDAIMLAPSSYTELVDAAAEVVNSGIKLVMVDSSMEQQLQSCLVGTDNFQAGQKMGQLLLENMPLNPVIGVVAHVKGASTAMEREKGLKDGLGEFKDKIVDTVFCDSDYQKAYKVTREMLEDNPAINVIAGINEYSAVGAARAVKGMGLEDQIVMVGFDSSIEEIQLLEEGVFKGIVIQKPFNMGYLSVQKAVESALGINVPPLVDSGSVMITKENMYTEENQKLLFHFRESN